MQSANILIVDHPSLFRTGLHKHLEGDGHRVWGLAQTGEETLALVRELQPDVVVLSNNLPDADGLSVCREIQETARETKVLLIVEDELNTDDSFHLEALYGGAVGCVPRSTPPHRWRRAIRYVLNGGAVFRMAAIQRAVTLGARLDQFQIKHVSDPGMLDSAEEERDLLIVERPSLFRKGLVAHLEDNGYHTVREASNANQAIDILVDWPADLVVSGVDLPGTNGFALTREVCAVHPSIKVLLTSWNAEDSDVQLRARQAGAVGCVSKHLSGHEYLSVIADALSGHYLFKDMDGRDDGYHQNGLDSLAEPLTPREEDVIDLISVGDTNKEIADRLCISERTVDKHVASILAKLNVSSRTEAAVKWVQASRRLSLGRSSS